MNRKKWLINITTLALALCVMAFGVYAAKSASLTTSGSIGFISHDADVTVVGTITGAMRGKEYNFAPLGTGTSEVNPEWKDSFTTIETDMSVEGATLATNDYLSDGESWTFGELFFDDMNQEGNNYSDEIIITLAISNYSDFAVEASISGLPETALEGLTITPTNADFIAAKSGETVSSANVAVSFKINDASKVEQSLKSMLNLNLTLNVERSAKIETSSTGWDGYVNNEGKFQITQAPTVAKGETLTVPETLVDEGTVYETILNRVEEGYAGYVNSSNKFVVTSAPQEKPVETINENALKSNSMATNIASNALSESNNIKASADTDEVYVPPYILSDNVVYATTVCSVDEGWSVSTYYTSSGKVYCIDKFPSNIDKNNVVVPSLLIKDGVTRYVSYIGNYPLDYIPIERPITPVEGLEGCTNITISSGIGWISQDAFAYCTSLRSVTFLASIGSISKNMFYGCTSLTDIEIPASVTSIGNSAFEDCTSLNEIEIPANVTRIDDYAFYGCTNLTNVIFEEGSQLQTIGTGAFSRCPVAGDEYGLIYFETTSGLVLYGANLNNVPSTVKIRNGVKSIPSGLFSGCTNLTSITIPASVTEIGSYAFSGCTSLANIEIPESVTSIGSSTFKGCTSLTNIQIPADVTIIGNSAFEGCTSLISITIPASVTRIDDYAFKGCTSLTNVIFEEGSQLETIGKDVFKDCLLLCDEYGLIYIETTSGLSLYGAILNNVPSTVEIQNGVKSIPSRLFLGCTNLTSIIIPASVTSIGDSAFSGCINLTTVTFGEGSQLETIGADIFKDCALEGDEYGLIYIQTTSELILLGANINNVPSTVEIQNGCKTIPSGLFSGCTNLTSITIPASVTSIGDSAFSGCTNLATVTFAEGSYLQTIGGSVFSDCTSLTSIEIPASVTTMSGSFSGSSITSIIIPAGVTTISGWDALETISFAKGSKLKTIDAYAFFECANLKSITIPASVTSIGERAFIDCYNLITVAFEEGSKLKSIGKYAFCRAFNYSASTSMVIPSSVTSINTDAFFSANVDTLIIDSPTIAAGKLSFGCTYTYVYVNTEITTLGSWTSNYTEVTDYSDYEGMDRTADGYDLYVKK